METQTEPTTFTDDRKFVNLQNDLQEFKRFAHNEILSLKAQTSNGNHTEKIGKIEKDYTYLKPLLRSFELRITSLEKQLEEKQRIIEVLIRRPSPYVNKPDHRPFSYSKKESGSNDISSHCGEFSNVYNSDRSSNATQSNLVYQNV